MKMQFAGKAALIAMVAICVTTAQASAASRHHRAHRVASTAQMVRVASAWPGFFMPTSFFVPATSMPIILGIGF